LLTALAFTSCNFLNIDDYIDEQLKYDSIFVTKRYVEAYMWDAARLFPDEGNIFGGDYTPGPMATDEAFSLFGSQGMNFVLGYITADNTGSYGTYWKRYHQVIRQCNIIFSRIGEVTDWETTAERTRILAYTRFIRAYAYYNLIINWGPIVILGDEIPGNNEEMEYYDRPRDLYDECMEYVCSEFEAASEILPEKALSIMDYGRPTKGAALALVARLRLIHASPLFNGGQVAQSYFGSWTRKTDGKHYISQTPDPRRWAVAAAAAKRVMDLTIQGGMKAYELHWVESDNNTPPLPTAVADPDYHKPFPEGAAGIDPYLSYSEMFNGGTVVYSNKEYIWARASGSVKSATGQSFPITLSGSSGNVNGMCVTQKIIDAYEMADGRLRTASSEDYPYSEDGFTDTLKIFSGYRLNEGVSNMYNNREMRFYASIGFSGCLWPCTSTTQTMYQNQTVDYYNGSRDGRSGAGVTRPNCYPLTGYVIKKYINSFDAYLGTNAQTLDKSFPIIRYAEILLSYAEALNELGGESFEINGEVFRRDVNEIRKYINQVRYRVGLPGITENEANDANYVLSKIKKERMIEFLYENRRYFDVRRWGDYEESENQTIMGMNTAANQDSYYQKVVPDHNWIGARIVNRRMIFLPIPRIELKRVASFDQNPGWD
jgi:hypothetical protein